MARCRTSSIDSRAKKCDDYTHPEFYMGPSSSKWKKTTCQLPVQGSEAIGLSVIEYIVMSSKPLTRSANRLSLATSTLAGYIRNDNCTSYTWNSYWVRCSGLLQWLASTSMETATFPWTLSPRRLLTVSVTQNLHERNFSQSAKAKAKRFCQQYRRWLNSLASHACVCMVAIIYDFLSSQVYWYQDSREFQNAVHGIHNCK